MQLPISECGMRNAECGLKRQSGVLRRLRRQRSRSVAPSQRHFPPLPMAVGEKPKMASTLAGAKSAIGKRVVVLGVLCLLLVSVYSLQRQIDTKAQRTFSDYLFMSLHSGQYLKTAALGFDSLIADLLWANTVVKVGERVVSDNNHEDLYRRLDVITALDPRFSEVYYFGSILLALQAGRVDESLMLLEKAVEAFPNDWRYHFNIGFNHIYYKNDIPKAITHFEKAVRMPGAPTYLSRFIGNLYAETGQIDMALMFLDQAYKHLPDERMREEIIEKMDALVIEKHKIVLENAVEQYKRTYGQYPATLDMLIETKLIDALPTTPYGDDYLIDPETGEVGVASQTLTLLNR